MATQDVGPSDPAVLRLIERQNAALLQPAGLTSPPAVTGGQASSSSSSSNVRSLAPIVSGSEVLYPQSTSSVSGNEVTITSSANNQSGDVTTVYTSSGKIAVTSINQTVYNYTAGAGGGITSLTGGQGINVTGTTDITISTIGNIGVINLDGNPSNVLHGDGTWSADQTNYANSNVAAYLPTYTGNVGANSIVSTGSSGSNVQINANGAVYTFGQGGALYWPATPGNIWVIEPNTDNEFEIRSSSNVVISTDVSNANSHFTFDSDGIFTAPSNVNLLGSRLNVGPDALGVTTLLNPTLVIANTGAEFIQAAIINNDATGSSDWTAEGAGGGDDQAWVDMGFTGYNFNDANYTITGSGDGYVFVQGYANGIGGHMVLATGDLGVNNDIIFATGGFSTSDELARFDHANSLLHFTRVGSGIKFQDGTIQTTAFTGGLGNIASLNLDGSASNVLYGNGTFAPVSAGSPAGSNTQIQFNSNGSFGATANLAFDDSTQLLTISGDSAQVNIGANTYVSNSQIWLGNTDWPNGAAYTQLTDTYVSVQDGTGATSRYAGISAPNGLQYSNAAFNINIDETGIYQWDNDLSSQYNVYANAGVRALYGGGSSTTINSTELDWTAADGNSFVANAAGAYHSQKLQAPNLVANTAFQLPVYADNTARDTSIVTPTTGMMVFVTGSGMQVYGATQWNPISGTAT